MTKINESRKAQTLTRLLRRINQGDDPELLRKEANQLLTNIAPRDIATAEQNLIADGYSARLVQLLSATFMLMGILEEQGGSSGVRLPANHILQIVTIEHELIRYFLADLTDVVETIEYLDLTDLSLEFRKLVHITEHLNAMKEHIEREDDVIFPYLQEQGRISLCQAMQGNHIDIRAEIDNLVRLVESFSELYLDQFKTRLIGITRRLCPMLLEHLSQEDDILYPIALGIINDVEVWERIKAVCDDIGYCSVHL